ncbi:MAG: 2-(1,2-epoxy,2-dihydrophenyl)acetyl-CoA isomerase [Chloroflexota bacterium]|jgi:2-(1,2-epoxy-1,2-dihydrophenyl)acetyl-CoA isomerase|nr:2-(1,2-epoxy,2-dihydrophenyl)acetyl-CoA isomerase [Chloroflexota bacterium]
MAAPAFETVGYEVADGVLTLTLNRPDALNAFNRQMKDELLAALKQAARDPAVRVLILTGAGRGFCAGQDLKETRSSDAPDLGAEIRARYNPLILAMRRLEKPIVGAINGVAAGAGCSIALACDLRIAAEGATFIQSFGRVGLAPDTGSSWFLPRLIGLAQAAEMILGAEPVEAHNAQRIGLVNRIVPAGRLMEEARALATRLAAGSPVALALGKRALNYALEHDLASTLEFESQLQSTAGRSDDHAEGVAAFTEKRPPDFKGR